MTGLLQSLKESTGPQVFRQELESKVEKVRAVARIALLIGTVKASIAPAVAAEEMLALFSTSLRQALEVSPRAEVSQLFSPEPVGETLVREPLDPSRIILTDITAAERTKPQFTRADDEKETANAIWLPSLKENQDVLRLISSPVDHLAKSIAQVETGEPALTEGGSPDFDAVPSATQPHSSALTRLQLALEEYHSVVVPSPLPKTGQSRQLSAMPHTPGAFPREKYRKIVPIQSEERSWPYPSTTELATPLQTYLGIAEPATAVQGTNDPTPHPIQNNGSEWLLGPSQQPRLQQDPSGVTNEDLGDLISTILREQALAHGIDLT